MGGSEVGWGTKPVIAEGMAWGGTGAQRLDFHDHVSHNNIFAQARFVNWGGGGGLFYVVAFLCV